MTRLGDVSDMLVGFAFKSTGFQEADSDGVRLLRGDNVQQGYIRWGDKTKKWPIAQSDELERYLLSEGDVILAMDRPIVGDGLKMAWISLEDLPVLLVQRVCRLRGKQDLALTNFIRYVLAAPDFSAHIHRITTGANIPHISGKDIAAYEFELPGLDDQSRIVDCLSAYDDLIATNQRRIALLEDAARRLYREWFVHLRFPGHESVPVKDGVPEGWQFGQLGSLIKTASGGTPSRKRADFFGAGIPWVKTKELNDGFIFETEEEITAEGLENSSAKVFPKGTVLLAMYGATIGMTALLARPAATNQACCAFMVDETRGLSYYCFQWLREIKQKLISLGMGAAQPNLSQDVIKKLDFTLPPTSVMDGYHEAVSPLSDQMAVLFQQNRALARARDLLLPKLMSGQLDASGIRLPDEVAL